MKTFFLFTVAVGVSLSVLVGISAAQDVVLESTEADPQQLPCPLHRLQYHCQITIPSFALTWILPTGDDLSFLTTRMVGAVLNSSDGLYSATLTNNTLNDAGLSFFSSSLLVLVPVNGSNLTCAGGTFSEQVRQGTTITLSGSPDPPSALGYDDTVVIESSVDLQWTRPSYTGGVALSNYSVSANGQRVVVSDVRENVSYTTSRLVYGEVQVTAINTCGQESGPASFIITAKAPPNLLNLSVELNCEDVSSPWNILWMYGQGKMGIVYPGDVSVGVSNVSHNVGTTLCSNLAVSDTNCTTNRPRGVYNITVDQTNAIGSTVDHLMIDTQVLTVGEDIGPTIYSVTVTVNSNCSEANYTVIVTFGSRQNGDSVCEGQRTATEQQLSPGMAVVFSLDTDSLTLGTEMEFCYIVSLNGMQVITGPDVPVTTSPSPTTSGPEAGSNTALIGGVVGGLVGGVLIAVICVLIIAIFWIRHRRNKEKNNDGLEMNVVSPGSPVTKETSVAAAPMYQDPNTISRTPHPTTGEVYTDVNLNTRTRKTEQVDSGPMYQDSGSIEHQEAPSGDVYAMPQKKTGKKEKKEKKEEPEEEGLTEEEKAALYSVPDRKTQKAKSAGLTYADVVIQPSSKPAPPPQGSTYADIKYN